MTLANKCIPHPSCLIFLQYLSLSFLPFCFVLSGCLVFSNKKLEMYKSNWGQRLPFGQFSVNTRGKNSQERISENYKQLKRPNKASMPRYLPSNFHQRSVQNFYLNSTDNCIKLRTMPSSENETKHSMSVIPEKTETKNVIKQEEHKRTNMNVKQNLSVKTKAIARVEKKDSMLMKYSVLKQLDKKENEIRLGSSVQKGFEKKSELDKASNSVLKEMCSKVTSIQTRKKRNIKKDTVKSQEDKVGSILRVSNSTAQIRQKASMSDKLTGHTFIKQNKMDLTKLGMNESKGKALHMREHGTATKVNLLEKKSLGYTAPGEKRNKSSITSKTSSLKKRNGNKELVKVDKNNHLVPVSEAVSKRIHELRRSHGITCKSKTLDSSKQSLDHRYDNRRNHRNSEGDRCKGTSVLKLPEILKNKTSRILSNDTEGKMVPQPVTSSSPVTVVPNKCIPSVTSLGVTGETKQDTELLKIDKSFTATQPFKDYSLPENNKCSYHMKIKDSTKLSTSALPDLETFGREIQKSEKQGNLNPAQVLKSVYDTRSSLPNVNTFHLSRKLYWEDVFTSSDCNLKKKNSSAEQSTPLNLSLGGNDSTDTCNSVPGNQADSKVCYKSQDVGYNLSVANSTKPSNIIISQREERMTEIPSIAYPMTTVSCYKQQFDGRNQFSWQHAAYTSQYDVNGIEKQVHNNKKRHAKIPSDDRGISLFNNYPQSCHWYPSTQNAFNCNHDMSSYDKGIFNTSCDSVNELRWTSQSVFTQQDESSASMHKQKSNYNSEHLFFKKQLMEFNQKSSMNVPDDEPLGTESLFINRETTQQKTTNKYMHEKHSVRTSYTKGMEGSWYDGCSQHDRNNIPTNTNQVINEMNINVFPTIVTIPGNKSVSETKGKTNDSYNIMTENEKNWTADTKNESKFDNETGKLPILFDLQSVFDEISQSRVLQVEKEVERETEITAFENSNNVKGPYSDENIKLNPSNICENIASNSSETSVDKVDYICKVSGGEIEEKEHVIDDITGKLMSKEHVVGISHSPKNTTAIDNKMLKNDEHIIDTEEVHCSKNSLDSSCNIQSSFNVNSNITVDSKITEKYKCPMVLMSPLKMTNELEDMIDNYITKNKLDSPDLPIIQSPSITIETPIIPRNASSKVSSFFSPPLLSPVELTTLNEKFPFDKDDTMSCRLIKKKNKRKSRSKVLKDIVPSKHNEREKTLIEDAETFLGADFLSKSARKRTMKTDINNNKKRIKKSKEDIAVIGNDNDKLPFEKMSENAEAEKEIQCNDYLKNKVDKTNTVDIVKDNATGLIKEDYDKGLTGHEIGDTKKDEKNLPLLHQLLKKRKHPFKFCIRIIKDDEKGKDWEIKNRSTSITTDIRKKSKSMNNHKLQQNKKVGAHFEKGEISDITKRNDEQFDKEIYAKKESIVKYKKRLEKSNKKRKYKDGGILNVSCTKEEKSFKDKLATKEDSLKQHKEANTDERIVNVKSQQLLQQRPVKKKNKSKYNKKITETSDTVSADFMTPSNNDDRREVKLVNKFDEIETGSGMKNANVTDRTYQKTLASTAQTDVLQKEKKKLKRQKLNLKESDKLAYNAKSNEVDKNVHLSKNTKVCKEIKGKVSKHTDVVWEDVERKFNSVNKSHKIDNKKETEAKKSAFDKDIKDCKKKKRMHGVEVDKGKKSTQINSTAVRNKNFKVGKISNCQDGHLPINSPKPKTKNKKGKKRKISECEVTSSVNLHKQEFERQTSFKSSGPKFETTKKGALKSRKMVSEHLKKYNKESRKVKKSRRSKSKKIPIKNDGLVTCGICKERFETKKHLDGHIVSHHPYKCMWCKVDFDNKVHV